MHEDQNAVAALRNIDADGLAESRLRRVQDDVLRGKILGRVAGLPVLGALDIAGLVAFRHRHVDPGEVQRIGSFRAENHARFGRRGARGGDKDFVSGGYPGVGYDRWLGGNEFVPAMIGATCNAQRSRRLR